MIQQHKRLGSVVTINGCFECPWFREYTRVIIDIVRLECHAYNVDLKEWPTLEQPKPPFCKIVGIPVQISDDLE